jgi:transcription elongation factor Elf1
MTTTKKRKNKPRERRTTEPKGFVCPECPGVALDVLDTRARANKVIVRRRKCPICNHRVTTEERPKKAA